VLFRDSDIKETIRVGLFKRLEARSVRHCRSDRHNL
jgi:hypothetical protein